jgi:hypothetical protein
MVKSHFVLNNIPNDLERQLGDRTPRSLGPSHCSSNFALSLRRYLAATKCSPRLALCCLQLRKQSGSSARFAPTSLWRTISGWFSHAAAAAPYQASSACTQPECLLSVHRDSLQTVHTKCAFSVHTVLNHDDRAQCAQCAHCAQWRTRFAAPVEHRGGFGTCVPKARGRTTCNSDEVDRASTRDSTQHSTRPAHPRVRRAWLDLRTSANSTHLQPVRASHGVPFRPVNPGPTGPQIATRRSHALLSHWPPQSTTRPWPGTGPHSDGWSPHHPRRAGFGPQSAGPGGSAS